MLKNLSLKQESHLFALGFLSVIALGSAALIALVIAALWLVFQVVVLALTSMIEALNTVGALYSTSDAFIRLLVLCLVGFLLYRAFLPVLKRCFHA